MKKLLLLILSAFICVALYSQAQQIKIVSFTVKNQLPEVIDTWNNLPGSILLVAQMNPGLRLDGIRLIIQIRANGAVVCSNNSAGGILVDNFTTRSFSANELTGALSGCHDLKEGSYSVCAQFFTSDRKEISNEVCKEFTVETPKVTDFAPPTLITPDDGKNYTEAELQRPVIFRWTPLVPKPTEPVTYRLRVWQLMQGQTGTQALRSNQPIITKEVDNVTQAVVTGVITGPCRPPYLCDFIWNVQALNREGKPVGKNEGTSEPWTFRVKGSAQTSGPVNKFPEDKKSISKEAAAKETMFEWTPVEPKQPTPVTYKLRVWQLMQGQSPAQVMKANKPLVDKEVTDVTKLAVCCQGGGPCNPPYLCDFIWIVEASVRSATGVPQVIGTSEPTVFFITQYIIQLDSLKVLCTNKPGQYNFSYIITNLNNTTAELISVLVQSSTPGGATITFTPPVGTTITASGGTLTVTGVITASPSLSNICIKTKIQKLGDPGKNAEDYLCDSVKPCRCDACDEKNFTFKAPSPGNITISNNTISFNQPISINAPGKTVTAVTADLVYFEMVPENDMCIPCNKDAATYGHFINGSNTLSLPIPLPQQVNINITTPQLTPCCSAVFKWCIRYKVEMKDSHGICTTCNVLVCYEKKKEGCEKLNPNPNNDKK